MAYAFYVGKNTSAVASETKVFIFDSVTKMRESFDNHISKYPIADANDRVDHVQAQNNVITFTGIITDFPIPNSLGNTDDSFNAVNTTSSTRIGSARKILLDYRDNATLFSFINKYKVYKDCVIQHVDFDKTASNDNFLEANITLQQIQISTTTSTVATVIEDDTASETSTGSGSKTTASDHEYSLWSSTVATGSSVTTEESSNSSS